MDNLSRSPSNHLLAISGPYWTQQAKAKSTFATKVLHILKTHPKGLTRICFKALSWSQRALTYNYFWINWGVSQKIENSSRHLKGAARRVVGERSCWGHSMTWKKRNQQNRLRTKSPDTTKSLWRDDISTPVRLNLHINRTKWAQFSIFSVSQELYRKHSY